MSQRTDDSSITFYRLQACPYCERVTRKLKEYDLDYQSRFVEPMHSDRNVVKRISGKRTVPAIVDENTGVTMSESANIVKYLDRTYGNGEVRADGGQRRGGGGQERADGEQERAGGGQKRSDGGRPRRDGDNRADGDRGGAE